MDAYLHTTNTKIAVFRDVIIESDYNPLTAKDASIRVPTGVWMTKTCIKCRGLDSTFLDFSFHLPDPP